jgi:hypothetical protein
MLQGWRFDGWTTWASSSTTLRTVALFTELGLEIDGRAQVEGAWVDSTVGLAGVRSDIV